MDDTPAQIPEQPDFSQFAALVHASDDEASAEAEKIASAGLAEAASAPEVEPGYQFAGLGVDIIEVERVMRAMQRTPRFAESVFTDDERAYCDSHAHPDRHYAARFAAKEAVAKALGTGFSGFGPHDIEVALNDKGKPVAVLAGRAAEAAEAAGVIAVHLSLSHTSELAIANAVAVTQEALPQRDERENPQERLLRAFKDVRGVLDEIDARRTGADAAPETDDSQSR